MPMVPPPSKSVDHAHAARDVPLLGGAPLQVSGRSLVRFFGRGVPPATAVRATGTPATRLARRPATRVARDDLDLSWHPAMVGRSDRDGCAAPALRSPSDMCGETAWPPIPSERHDDATNGLDRVLRRAAGGMHRWQRRRDEYPADGSAHGDAPCAPGQSVAQDVNSGSTSRTNASTCASPSPGHPQTR